MLRRKGRIWSQDITTSGSKPFSCFHFFYLFVLRWIQWVSSEGFTLNRRFGWYYVRKLIQPQSVCSSKSGALRRKVTKCFCVHGCCGGMVVWSESISRVFMRTRRGVGQLSSDFWHFCQTKALRKPVQLLWLTVNDWKVIGEAKQSRPDEIY